MVAKLNNKLETHDMKWSKCKSDWHTILLPLASVINFFHVNREEYTGVCLFVCFFLFFSVCNCVCVCVGCIYV